MSIYAYGDAEMEERLRKMYGLSPSGRFEEEKRKERLASAAREKVRKSKIRAFARKHKLSIEEAELIYEN